MKNQITLNLPDHDSPEGVSKQTLEMYCQKKGISVDEFCNKVIATAMNFEHSSTDTDEGETPLPHAGMEPSKDF